MSETGLPDLGPHVWRTAEKPVGRCGYPGCITRWRDGVDRPCSREHSNWLQAAEQRDAVRAALAWTDDEKTWYAAEREADGWAELMEEAPVGAVEGDGE